MDPNNNPINTQNSTNYPFHYPNPNNFQFQNQFSNQPHPQNIPNYGFPPNFSMPSTIPNYHPYYGSMMPYPPQTQDFPEFSTQMSLGGTSGVNDEITPTVEEPALAPVRKNKPQWNTAQNLVLLSGYIKYGTDSIIGRNQKSEAFWRKVADYCNEHCSFDKPCDGESCRNHHNYINKKLGKWVGAYDNAKRMQQSGWSENDVLAKAHELYSSGRSGHFNLIQEWLAVRDQPQYRSQTGGNTGSGSSGSKRTRESDASDSNSVGSSARPIGREAAKKKGKKKDKGVPLEVVNEEWNEFKKYKEQELQRLDNIAMKQEEANQLMKEKNQSKKMKMFLKLSEKEHLNDRNKELLAKLTHDLFEN